MPTLEIFVIACLGAAVWFWVDSLRAREAGMDAAREGCRVAGLQLLDDTVSTSSVRLARNDQGHVALRRVYAFEYSDTGNNRRSGSVTVLGSRVIMLSVQPQVVEVI